MTDVERTAHRVPILTPTPPLQSLTLNGRDPEQRAAAADLAAWLKLNAEQAVADCWRTVPRLPVWAEFSASLSARDRDTVGVNALQLIRIHGDYPLNDAETRCFASALSGITARGGSGNIIQTLHAVLPVTESFVVQWPCVTCRAPSN